MIENNWKIEELLNNHHSIEIINLPSQNFEKQLLVDLDLPLLDCTTISNDATSIDWKKVDNDYHFCVDDFEESTIIKSLKKSIFSRYENIIMTFGWNETVVKIPNILFLNDPLEFFFSKRWEGIIISEDYKFVIEISHDYIVHSNFRIL